jgi:hypothetical protein
MNDLCQWPSHVDPPLAGLPSTSSDAPRAISARRWAAVKPLADGSSGKRGKDLPIAYPAVTAICSPSRSTVAQNLPVQPALVVPERQRLSLANPFEIVYYSLTAN